MIEQLESIILVVSAPSGAGKTSLVNSLLDQTQHPMAMCVSHTTRQKRAGEIHGRDYYFIDHQTFETMRQQGAFIEYAQVYGHYYGTSLAEIKNVLQAKKNVVLEIDWQGARQVRHHFGNRVISVFILPPSKETLIQRLDSRRQDSKAIIDHRMAQAKNEMQHYDEYDYCIVNDDFNVSLRNLGSIIDVGQLNYFNQHHLSKVINDLL